MDKSTSVCEGTAMKENFHSLEYNLVVNVSVVIQSIQVTRLTKTSVTMLVQAMMAKNVEAILP